MNNFTLKMLKSQVYCDCARLKIISALKCNAFRRKSNTIYNQSKESLGSQSNYHLRTNGNLNEAIFWNLKRKIITVCFHSLYFAKFWKAICFNDHSFSMHAKHSEKLIVWNYMYMCVGVRIVSFGENFAFVFK